jgi:hypothetical protein
MKSKVSLGGSTRTYGAAPTSMFRDNIVYSSTAAFLDSKIAPPEAPGTPAISTEGGNTIFTWTAPNDPSNSPAIWSEILYLHNTTVLTNANVDAIATSFGGWNRQVVGAGIAVTGVLWATIEDPPGEYQFAVRYKNDPYGLIGGIATASHIF